MFGISSSGRNPIFRFQLLVFGGVCFSFFPCHLQTEAMVRFREEIFTWDILGYHNFKASMYLEVKRTHIYIYIYIYVHIIQRDQRI